MLHARELTRLGLPGSGRRLFACLALCSAAAFNPALASPSMPDAGLPIGNAASASFTLGDGPLEHVTSNKVTTIVTATYAVELDRGQSRQQKQAAAGQTVRFAHQISNLGNAQDSFLISIGRITPDIDGGVQLFADSDGDGQPDPGTAPIDLPVGAAAQGFRLPGITPRDGSIHFVLSARLKATLGSTANPGFSIVVASATDPKQTTAGDDSMLLVEGATFEVAPQQRTLQMDLGQPVALAFNVNNTSLADGAVVLKHVLGTDRSTGLTFVDGSLSIMGQKVDSQRNPTINGKPARIKIDKQGELATLTAAFYLLAGQHGTIGFDVSAAKPAADGRPFEVGAAYAQAKVDANGVPVVDQNAVPLPHSTYLQALPVRVELRHSSGVHIIGPEAPVNSTLYGMTEKMKYAVTNTGNQPDTFNLSTDQSSFPPGTVFTFYSSDATLALADTNGDGLPDTGAIGSGDHDPVWIVLGIDIPAASATDPTLSNAQVTITAKSPRTRAQYSVAATIHQIAPAQVALTKDTAYAGAGKLPSQFTASVDPAQALMLTLFVNNTSAVDKAERYGLRAIADDSSVQVSLHAPSGGSCSVEHVGPGLAQTGAVGKGSAKAQKICALIAALGARAQTQVVFTATSTRTGATHALTGALVGGTHAFAIESRYAGSVRAGNTITYQHAIVNTGSAPIAARALTATVQDSAADWRTQIYRDPGEKGLIDSANLLADGVIAEAIEPGARISLLLAVTASAAAMEGNRDLTTLTIDGGEKLGRSSITDATTISRGDVALLKEQALDPHCATLPPGAPQFSRSNIHAEPGQCVWYRVTVSNPGAVNVAGLEIHDRIPAYTKLEVAPTLVDGTAPVGAVHVNGTEIRANADVLKPARRCELTYSVRIDR